MATVDFSSTFTQLTHGITSLAQTTVADYVREAESDGNAFLAQIKDDLETWTLFVAEGKLTKTGLAELIEGDASLIKMEALTQAGLAQIALDNFKNGVFSLIENTIFGII
jgi:hypothetical protein